MIIETDGPHKFYAGESPDEGAIVVAFKGKEAKQCEYRDGNYFVWEYKITDQVFATDETVTKWRGCTGFDF